MVGHYSLSLRRRTWAHRQMIQPLISYLPLKSVSLSNSLIAENSKPWYNNFTKTVFEEYLQTSWISLVGTVGGTLGLFVGISFLELGSWVQSKLSVLARRIKRL